MTEQNWIDLGKRAVACERWWWRVGMAARFYTPELGWREWRVNRSSWLSRARGNVAEIDVVANISPGYAGMVPDLRDPATVGCLLALVREAWGECLKNQHAVSVEPFHIVSMDAKGWIITPQELVGVISAPTEAEALVAALEAAPSKEKPDE